MKKIRVAMIGAGATGTPLLEQLLRAPFVEMAGVADLDLALPGITLARQHGVAVTDDFLELAGQGEAIDVIIDVTGSPKVREALRALMQSSGNHHTVIVHERVAILMMSLGAGELVETRHAETGY